jgi:hypothetical protein
MPEIASPGNDRRRFNVVIAVAKSAHHRLIDRVEVEANADLGEDDQHRPELQARSAVEGKDRAEKLGCFHRPRRQPAAHLRFAGLAGAALLRGREGEICADEAIDSAAMLC